MQAGLAAVREAIGQTSAVTDSEIKESLWYYYFDSDATIAWLRKTYKLKPKVRGADTPFRMGLPAIGNIDEHEEAALANYRHRPGPPPSAARGTSQPRPQPPPATGTSSLKSLSALGGAAGRGLGGLSSRAQPGAAPLSVVGMALSALKARPGVAPAATSAGARPGGGLLSQIGSLSSRQPARPARGPAPMNFAGRQVPSLKSMASGTGAGRVAESHQRQRQAELGTGAAAAATTTLYAQPSALAQFILGAGGARSGAGSATEAMGGLRQEIAGLLEACRQKSGAKKFGFDTPSPDDRVLSAQGAATGAAPGKKPKAQPATKGPSATEPTKELEQLKISDAPATPPKRKIDVEAEYAKTQGEHDTLNLVVVGHVDAGKSTLMGHMLYALGQVSERALRKLEQEAGRIGKGSFAYAWVLDATDEERARGVTMDVATGSFATAHRRFTILDAPGHRDFVPNMISGASRADVAVLVVDASTGGFESGFDRGGQTREHALLVRSLGVSQLVVAVNKLDMVSWDAARYEEVVARLGAFLLSCGFHKDDVRYVPVSGLGGVNLARRADPGAGAAELAAWYRDAADPGQPGPCLVDFLDTFALPERAVSRPLRVAVSDFFKGGGAGSVSISGRIGQGTVQVGERVMLVPGGECGVVKAIDVDYVSASWAVAGDAVVLTIQGIDIQQFAVGAVVCAPERPISVTARFEAKLAVFEPPVPITNGFSALLHTQSLSVPAVVRQIIETIDQRTGEVLKRHPRHIRKGTTARVEIVTESRVCLELFQDARELGRVMLRKGGETIAAGIVTAIRD
ncbi:hypothetical protein IWQ57_001997 [Coemansia nantahalensis]|uniref:Uncharacterized protein n=1 Tax=Coemansia nantahalensis TaxID=2789366 RepID=A0ACC1K2P7_9FUNG|nr:hypothetical protein IWQ57_001997 [Coemansia nantahalensis]